MSKTLSNY